MYRNLVADVLRYEKITTTEAKAKEVCGMVEKVVTLGKKNTMEARRQALRLVGNGNEEVVKKTFGEIAPRYAGRDGGYTRILKLGHRNGDAAPMAQLELVK